MGCGKSRHEAATGNAIARTKSQKSKHDRSLCQREERENKGTCGKSNHEVATGNTIAITKSQKSKHDGSSSSFQRHEGENRGANPKELQNREAKTKHEIVANVDSRESVDEKKIESNGQEWIDGTSAGDVVTVEAIISDGISGRTVYYSPDNKVGANGERLNNRVEEKASIEYEIREIKNVCN